MSFSVRFWSRGKVFWVELQRGETPCGSLSRFGEQGVGSADPFLIPFFLWLPKRNCSKSICLYVLLLLQGFSFLPAAAFVVRVPWPSPVGTEWRRTDVMSGCKYVSQWAAVYCWFLLFLVYLPVVNTFRLSSVSEPIRVVNFKEVMSSLSICCVGQNLCI